MCYYSLGVTIIIGSSCVCFFFFQAEDGIRDLVRSRGLGDVYKRQARPLIILAHGGSFIGGNKTNDGVCTQLCTQFAKLSLIHI
mgnify:CR=1 FL=1